MHDYWSIIIGRWNFYFSGIIYGKIQESRAGLYVQKWLSGSGSWSGWLPFDDEADKAFAVLCKRSILHFFKNRKEYETLIQEYSETFTTKERGTILADWEKIYPGETQKDGEYQPGSVYTVDFKGTFHVFTRDGETLATDVYVPQNADDTLNWIAAQDFSAGQVGMTGGSYLGYVQWAAAASGNPHLKAMLSSVCAGSAFAYGNE